MSITETDTKATESKLPKTLQDVDSEYFAPSQIATNGVALLQHLTTLKDESGKDVTPILNGNWGETGEFPPTHGLYILPIGETVEKDGEKKRVTKHVVAAAIPTLDALLAREDGREYVERAMQAAFSAKIRNSLIRAEDIAGVQLPLTVEQFIERSERGAADQGLAAYKAIGPALVKALGNKGVQTNMNLLRQILSSAAFAKALMPKVSQAVWVKVLETAKKHATEKKLPTTIFDHWLETRDAMAIDVAMEDIDLA